MGRNLFDNLMIVIATIVVIGLLFVIPRNFDFLNPVGKAFGVQGASSSTRRTTRMARTIFGRGRLFSGRTF